MVLLLALFQLGAAADWGSTCEEASFPSSEELDSSSLPEEPELDVLSGSTANVFALNVAP